MACTYLFLAALGMMASLPAAEGALRGSAEAASSFELYLVQLERALSADSGLPEVEERVAEHIENMRPVFQALPQSEEGLLEASAVRYLLHRYFIDRRGWFVPVSGRDEVADETLPDLLLPGRATLAAEFRTRLANRGLSLSEVAMLAAALESLASIETAERLRIAFSLAEYAPDSRVDETQVEEVMRLYMNLYKVGRGFDETDKNKLVAEMEIVLADIPNWDELMTWTQEVRAEVVAGAPELQNSFEGLVNVFETIQDRYGRWSDQACLSVKQYMKQSVTPGTGRIPLDVFYTLSLPNGWEIHETSEDLRGMGALDETDPQKPSLVVPNYFDIPDNCEDPSKYYSVCCISECESLMKHLEHELGSPDAHPLNIIEIVEKLPSASIEAPRVLPTALLQRLESLAEMHGGHAKLHSRLFRQWMHHAFPSECTFPSLSSGAAPESPESRSVGDAEELPWFEDDEEYLTCQGPPKESAPKGSAMTPSWVNITGLPLLVIAFVVVRMLAQELRDLRLKREGSMAYTKQHV